MNRELIKKSDSDSKTATEWLDSIKENTDIGLTSTDLLYFLKFFKFIDECKNDKYINVGYKPKKNYIKKGILQYDIYEFYRKSILCKRDYRIKITKKGQNYLMPFVQQLIDLKKVVKIIKKQK